MKKKEKGNIHLFPNIKTRTLNHIPLSCVSREKNRAENQLDLEEALQASRNASQSYSTHRREVSLFEAISLISFVGDIGFSNSKEN